MTTEIENPNGEGTPNDEQGTQQVNEPSPTQSENLTISKQEYASLVTQLAMLQNRLDEAQEEKQAQQAQQPPTYAGKQLNELTNEELMHLISTQSGQQNQQMLSTLVQLAVKEEIRDMGDKYEDFKKDKSLRDEVLAIAEKNTHLSLEQAYLIHQGQKAKSGMKQQMQQTTTPTPSPGEKPGVSQQAVQQDKPMSAREAAEAAFKALKYD